MKTISEMLGDGSPPSDTTNSPADLKFVSVDLGEELGGGWYRELPNAQVEIMSRAQLERVPLENADAEATAREKISEMWIRRVHRHAEQLPADAVTTDEAEDETQ